MDTSGFYKLFGDTLVYAPNWVECQDYRLDRAEKDSYTYPVDGWDWFDSEDLAYAAHGLPIPDNSPPVDPLLPGGSPFDFP